MSRRVWQWFIGVIAAVLIAGCGVIFWLVATEGGTRWLVGQATPRLPASLQVAEVSGTLLNGVRIRSLSWNDDQLRVSVAQVDARFELLPLIRRVVRINDLDVREVDVFVAEPPPGQAGAEPLVLDLPITLVIERASITNAHAVTGAGEVEIASVDLSGRLSGSALKIGRLDVKSNLGDIGLSGTANLTGPYPVAANASWTLRLADQPPMSGNARLRGDMSEYEVEHDLSAPYEINTTGAFTIVDSDVVLDLANTWRHVSINASEDRTIDLTDGELLVRGTVNAFSFDGHALAASDGIPAIAVTMQGSRKADRIEFESVSASNDWGQVSAIGEIFVTPELSSSFTVEASGVVPAMNGTPAIGPVKATGVLGYAGSRLQVDDAVVLVGDNRVDFDGAYGKRLQGNAVLSLANLGQLGIDATGILNGVIQVSSDLKSFEASGKLNGSSLEWRGYGANKLVAEFRVPKTGAGSALLELTDAHMEGVSLASARLTAAGSAQSHEVAAEVVAEQGRGELVLDGGLAGETWSGVVRRLGIDEQQLGEWALRQPADLSVSRSRVRIENTCMTSESSGGIVCGMVDFDVSGPLKFDVSVKELPVAALVGNLPEGTRISGSIEARATGEFANRVLAANSDLSVQGLLLETSFEGEELSARFDRAFANASIVNNGLSGMFELRLADATDHIRSNIEINDVFDRNSKLSGNGSLEFNDLDLLSFFFPDLTNPVGKITGNVVVAGSLGAPDIIGEIALTGGSAGIRRAGIELKDVELMVRQTRAGQLALQGSAKSGEGQLAIQGETTLGSDSGVRTELKVSGENFTLLQLPEWQVVTTPDIKVVFDDRETRVTGKLGIPKANIQIHEIPETADRPSPDVVVHRDDETNTAKQRMLYVDVRTSLGDDVSLSGFGLTTDLEGSVRVRGSSASPYVSTGRVVLRDGRYRAYGQVLEIENGELIFNGPLTEPTLNIRATRTASDNTVAGIHLTGTPAQLRSVVYSEPALGDAEALSYLLTGRPLSSADSDEGDMLNQAAFALGLTSAGNVASRIQNELGLDTLGVKGSSQNRQLVAGKRLGSRLLVEYAYGLVDNLGTLLLRYQLNSRLILESRSGSIRTLDIVYTVKKP